MSASSLKRKKGVKTLKKKYDALKDVESGMSVGRVAQKYEVGKVHCMIGLIPKKY